MKRIRVRKWRSDDFETVADLQRRCFTQMTPWTREQFDSMLKIFPEGQLVIEYDGKVVASSSSHILIFQIILKRAPGPN